MKCLFKCLPQLYNKAEIDKFIECVETTSGLEKKLNLEQTTLSISEGSSISFEGWDSNATDDFSVIDDDLQNKPELYNKTNIDNLIECIETTRDSPQYLNFEGSTLSISEGNSISFENWDTKVADNFDGEYSSLSDASEIYTNEEVDAIKAEIMKDVEANFTKKAEVISFTFSRSINPNDVINTIVCIYSSKLTINSGFSALQVGDIINLEIHGTTLTVNRTSGVIINGKTSGYNSIRYD
jgi:hypothetical protein